MRRRSVSFTINSRRRVGMSGAVTVRSGLTLLTPAATRMVRDLNKLYRRRNTRPLSKQQSLHWRKRSIALGEAINHTPIVHVKQTTASRLTYQISSVANVVYVSRIAVKARHVKYGVCPGGTRWDQVGPGHNSVPQKIKNN